MLNKEVFLYKEKDSEYTSKFNINAYSNKDLFKFDILKHFNIFKNDFDYLHLININKVTGKKSNLESYFTNKEELLSFNKFKENYIKLIPIFNQKLYEKYNELFLDFNPDCIILPESKNEWLRDGLAELFSIKLKNIPIFYAKKNTDFQMSELKDNITDAHCFCIEIDKNFKKVLILDDSKSIGNTANMILKELNILDYVHVYYFKYDK